MQFVCAAAPQQQENGTTVNQQLVWSVSKEAREFLSHLHEPIRLVSAVGPYREGKSWLLKRIMENENLFTVSSTVKPQTRGVWLSNTFLPGTNILALDTEGLGSPDSTRAIDTMILAVAMLFSSKVIFNSKGAINTNSLESLECAIGTAEWLSKQAAASEEEGGASLCNSKPHLLWVLRDFSLDIVDDNHNPITATQYLEESLSKPNAKSLHDSLQKLLAMRHCIALPVPTTRPSDLIEMRNLVPAFSNGVKAVQDNVRTTPPKRIGRCEMTGPVLLAMADKLCSLLSKEGGTPNLHSVWESACMAANMEAKYQSLEMFGRVLQSQFTPKPKICQWSLETLCVLLAEAMRVWNSKAQDVKMEDTIALLDQCFRHVISQSNSKNEQWKQQLTQAIGKTEDIMHLLPECLRDVIAPIVERCKQMEQEFVMLKAQYEETQATLEHVQATQHPSLTSALSTVEELRATKEELQLSQRELQEVLDMHNIYREETHTQQNQLEQVMQEQAIEMQNYKTKQEQALKDAIHFQHQAENLTQSVQIKASECESLRQSLKDSAREMSEHSRKRTLLEAQLTSEKTQVALLQQQKSTCDQTLKTIQEEAARLRSDNFKLQCRNDIRSNNNAIQTKHLYHHQNGSSSSSTNGF